jgi:hypothetical protein
MSNNIIHLQDQFLISRVFQKMSSSVQTKEPGMRASPIQEWLRTPTSSTQKKKQLAGLVKCHRELLFGVQYS